MQDEGRRLQVLAAMGVDVYQLRDTSGVASPALTTGGRENGGASAANVVAVCARGVSTELRLARLFALLPRALGANAARLTWVEMSADETVPTLPEVPCYLFVGSATARACAAQLSLTQQNQATIAVCAEPHELLSGAPARRALWHAVKPLARRLRAGAG